MFHWDHKKTLSSKNTKPLKDLLTLESPETLLSMPKRQEFVDKIKQLSGLEAECFEDMALSLIHHVASYCQNLPDTVQYYAGCMLDFILNRTETALHLLKQYLTQGANAEPTEEQKLWLYALFSAGLLQGLGKLAIEYSVNLYDKHGQWIKLWQPLLENPLQIGDKYHYEFLKSTEEEFRHRLNILLAHQLMPKKGFAWIVSHPKIFMVWLALLDEDIDGAGTLGAILDRARALTMQRQLNVLRLKSGATSNLSPKTPRVATFIDTTPSSGTLIDKEKTLAIDFVQWLIEALASGKILVNKAPIFVAIPGGMLMSAKLFEMFIQSHPHYKSAQNVQKAFLSLGLHQTNADGSVISRFESSQTQEALSGLVVDYAVLPSQIYVCDADTQQAKLVSSLDFIQWAKAHPGQIQTSAQDIQSLPQLSESGEWKRSSEVKAYKPGLIRRG